jgi:predicted transcriptional regulator
LKKRTRSEIIADILLTLANGAATRTRVMYNVFLTFEQVTDYLHYLLDRSLIEFDQGAKLYRITTRGMELLDACEGASNLTQIAPFDRVGASF